LSELKVKCVIGFTKFFDNFKGLMKMGKRDHHFQCSA